MSSSHAYYYVCKYCQRVFLEPSMLVEHKKSLHWADVIRDRKLRKAALDGKKDQAIEPHSPGLLTEETSTENQPRVQNFNSASESANSPRLAVVAPVSADGSKSSPSSAQSSTDEAETTYRADSDNHSQIVSTPSTLACSPGSAESNSATEEDRNSTTALATPNNASITPTPTIMSMSTQSMVVSDEVPPRDFSFDPPNVHAQTTVARNLRKQPQKTTVFQSGSVAATATTTETPRRKFKCLHCPKEFSSSWNCKLHMSVHTGMKPIKCPHCPTILYKDEDLETHVRTQHESESTAGTELAAQAVMSTSSKIAIVGPNNANKRPRKRRRFRLSSNHYRCKVCFQSFASKANLQSHIQTRHQTVRFHRCNYCPGSFKTFSELITHRIRLHSGELEAQKQTELIQGSEQETLAEMIDYLGNPEEPNTSLVATLPTGSNSMGTEASAIVEKTLKCTHCPRKFKYAQNLVKHERLVHRVSNVQKAMREIRDKIGKPWKCSYCPKFFSLKTSLKVHERIHTGERPYKCPNCPQAFTQSHVLKEHVRIHTGEKPYACAVCGKRFSHKSCYKNHCKLCSIDKIMKIDENGVSNSGVAQIVSHQKFVREVRPTMVTNKASRILTKMVTLGSFKPIELATGVTQLLHNNLLQYICNTCGEHFDYRVDANKHMQIHNKAQG